MTGSTPHFKGAVLTHFGGGGGGPARIMFHGMFGTVNCFRMLIGHLINQKIGPVFGISAADMQKYCAMEVETLIQTIAADYANRIAATGGHDHRQEQSLVSRIPQKYIAVYKEEVKRIKNRRNSEPGIIFVLEKIYRIRLIIDFIAGMTDAYALHTFKLISGIHTGK